MTVAICVNITTAARITGRSEKTIRRWLREDPCPLTVKLAPGLGSPGAHATQVRLIDVATLREVHRSRGGLVWHEAFVPADPEPFAREVADLRERVTTLEVQVASALGRLDAITTRLGLAPE